MVNNKPNLPPEIWLRTEVGTGLQRLFVLRLPSGPFTEQELLANAEIWLQALLDRPITWSETLDRQRVAQAFLTLAAECERWPNPKTLWDRLGPRFEPLTLPAPRQTPEQRRASLEKIQALRKQYLSQEQTHE